jgi:hypothetical protein
MEGPEPNLEAVRDGSSVGHAHCWERALSRRQLLGTAAGAAGAAATAGLWLPAHAEAAGLPGSRPNPIPGGTDTPFGRLHFYFPTDGPPGAKTIESGEGDPSTIGDFNGKVGVAEFPRTGTGTDSTGTPMNWGADVRFMTGEYVGLDGRKHRAAFAFV